MIRAIICLLLIIASTLTVLPLGPQYAFDASNSSASTQSSHLLALDPSGSSLAFNVSYTHFDLYTRINTTLALSDPTLPGNATWLSRFTNSSGSQIPDTAFLYRLPANATMVQTINYTLNIPRGVGTDTFITFKWNGTVGGGTVARYLVYNGTGTNAALIFPAANVTNQGPTTFAGGPPVNATGGNPFSCSSSEECMRVTGFIGFNLTLSFVFNSTATGNGIDVEVRNVIVASVSTTFSPATSHNMNISPSNSTEVEHTGQLALVYNATVTYPKPSNSSQLLVHTWRQIVSTLFLPTSYTLEMTRDTIKLNGTIGIFPEDTPIGRGSCTMSLCTNSSFISFNMTSRTSTATIAEIKVRSINAVSYVQPLLTGVATDFLMPGDTFGVRMRSQPGVNVSGSHIVAFADPNGITILNQTFTNKGGSYLYNMTIPSAVTLGKWNVTGVFLNGYDYGRLVHTVRVEQIRTDSLATTGEAGQGKTLTVQGTLAYMSNSSAAGAVNATVFAVDAGSPPGPISSMGSPSTGLYVSNVTLTNGVFTQNQPLIVFFAVTNPTLSQAFSANVTLEHEWYSGSGGSHGATVTFPLELGDQPFNISPSSIYRMDISLTSGGVQVTVKSVTTNNKLTVTLGSGSSAILSSRQHFGSFKVSIESIPTVGDKTVNFLRSPTYAYVLHAPLIPSRLLGFSPTVTTASNGSFSTTIAADKLLGARKLALFVLARDANGIALGKDQTTTVTDSTLLTPTANIPGEVTVKQSVTATLNLKSDSTNLPITLTVNLDLSGSGTVATKTITIQPGTTKPAEFTFTAPAAAGSYLLTFSSPQYGAPLLPKTLNVVLLQSSLQILIPAIIGLVAALAILGFYLIRKQPETKMEEEKKRPSPGKPSKPQQGSSSSKSLTRS